MLPVGLVGHLAPRVHPHPVPGPTPARVDHLGFSQMDTSYGRVTWDAPVSRVEAAVSYSPERHLQVRAGYQYNWRDGGRVREEGLAVAQLLVWF